MVEIYFTINGIPKTKQLHNQHKFYEFVSEIKKNNPDEFMKHVDYGKIWLLDLDENSDPLFVFKKNDELNEYFIINTEQKFSEHLIVEDSNLSIEYSKFICAAWGTLLYLEINDLPEYVSYDDINIFVNKFSPKEIKQITNELIDDSLKNSEDTVDWVQSGMSMNKRIYLSRIVIDYFFGNILRPLEESMVIYRTIGYSAQEHSDKNYHGWVSATKGKPYDTEHNTQKYILPVGFPIIDTNINGINYADNNEIIVRNEDLQKL